MTPDQELAAAEQHDHARAGERGERLRLIANDVVSKFLQHGILREPREARIVAFHVLADWLYPNRSLDIPTDLGEP